MKRLFVVAATVLLAMPPAPAAAAPSCFGRRATIVGTRDDDVIRGTSGPDVIAGLAGGDEIRGNGGDDRICGGEGNDDLYGGDGADRIESGRRGWEERAVGGNGADLLVGGSRNANCDGFWVLEGGLGNDRLVAAPDTVCVTMLGGWGRDRLTTGTGGGTMIGGPDDDVMTGRGTFEGGAGDDVMRGRGPSHAVFDDPAGVNVDLVRGVAVGAGEGRDVLEGIASVTTTDGDDVVRGDDLPNVIVGNDGDDTLFGGDGDDVIEGREGDDEVDGGGGRDRVMAAPGGHDVVSGGADDDYLSNEISPDFNRDPIGADYDGGAGRDYLSLGLFRTPSVREPVTIDLTGTSSVGSHPMVVLGVEDVDVSSRGRVEVRGDDGPNRIRIDAEETDLYGRGGDDLLQPDGVAVVDGGDGFDTVDFTGPGPLSVDLAAGTFTSPYRNGSVAGTERVVGSWDANTFRGDDRPNAFVGGFDDDDASGLGGDDMLDGGFGDDRLDGGDGNDALDGGDGTDTCTNGETVSDCE